MFKFIEPIQMNSKKIAAVLLLSSLFVAILVISERNEKSEYQVDFLSRDLLRKYPDRGEQGFETTGDYGIVN
jgi:hypothetical protein